MKPYLNTARLILTITGALLIWFFLGELNFAKKDEYLKGRGEIEIPNPKPDDIKLSRTGIVLIVVGGFLQILSNYCDA